MIVPAPAFDSVTATVVVDVIVDVDTTGPVVVVSKFPVTHIAKSCEECFSTDCHFVNGYR